MTRRFASLRARLLLAMLAPSLVAIAVAYAMYTAIEQATAQASDQQNADEVVAGLAAIASSSTTFPGPTVLHAVLPDYQVVIMRDGQPAVNGPLPQGVASRRLELTAVHNFPGGSVTLRDFTSPEQTAPYELIFAAAAPVVLLVLSAFAATSYLSRALSRQIRHASSAAERVAAGDLTARMGTGSAGEFVPLARAFDGMAARLDASDREQRDFLGDLVHELATPVSAISGTGLALADGTVSTEEDRHEAAETLTRETRRLQDLLADLGNLTRLDVVQGGSHHPVALDRLCREVVARHLPSARAAGVELLAHASSVTVMSDPRLIATVVDNFVANAIRYTPARGRVRIEARRQRNEAVISVQDTGIGIPDEHRERIFDRFYRVDEARQRDTGGSGLGLSLARRAASQLGGRIELSTAGGEGSTFRLIIPVRLPLPDAASGNVSRRRG